MGAEFFLPPFLLYYINRYTKQKAPSDPTPDASLNTLYLLKDMSDCIYNIKDFSFFLNSDGGVNVNLSRKHESFIIENTKEYDFLSPSLGQRVRLKIDAPKTFYCKCGKRLSWNRSKGYVFLKTCGDTNCVSNEMDRTGIAVKIRNTINNRRSFGTYSIDEQIEYILSALKVNRNPNYILSRKTDDIALYVSERSKEESIRPIEYCYRLINGITETPKCVCGNSVSFASFEVGYKNYCSNCKTLKSGDTKKRNRIETLKKDLDIAGYTLLSDGGINDGTIEVKHNKCGHTFSRWMNNGFIPYSEMCPKCYPKTISTYEYRLIDEIRKFHSGQIDTQFRLENTKNKTSYKSIDVYIPDARLGIEINGLYWHADNKRRHIDKLDSANELGIQLIQFTDVDIDNKLPIVLSIIKHKLGMSRKIGARKTTIKEINSKDYRSFVEKNHIHGYAPASIKLGMFYDNVLTSVLSVSKSRFKKDEYEIIRQCSILNHTVVGGLSKFKKYLSTNYSHINKLITFADKSYGSGNGYASIGATWIGNTKPNYWYFRDGNDYRLQSRQSFQKHKLSDKLDFYDDNLSEEDLMKIAGFKRYYDCGSAKYEIAL